MDLWPWRSKGSIWSLFSHRSSCTLNNGRKQHNENSNTSFQNCYYIYHLIYTLWRGHFLFWVPRKTYFWTWNTSSSFLTLWKIKKKKGYSSETHNMHCKAWRDIQFCQYLQGCLGFHLVLALPVIKGERGRLTLWCSLHWQQSTKWI